MDDRLRAVIGTLAHNRSFTAHEITEYTRFDVLPYHGKHVVRRLLKRGLIARGFTSKWYYPTNAGWLWIENGNDNG